MQIDGAQQNADYSGMSDVDEKRAQLRRTQLRRFAESRGLKYRAWARAAGLKSDGTIRNFLDGATKSMTQETVEKLARAAKVSVQEIFPPDTAEVEINKPRVTKQGVASQNELPLGYVREIRPTGLRDLPIKGHTKAGEMGFFLDQGETWGFAMRPETLRGVEGAYAVRVHDDSMEPRYRAGLVLNVDPFRQPNPGDNIIIQLIDGQCFVKELVRRAAGLVVCRQFNPAKLLEFRQAKVKAIHLVVGVDYLER